MRRMRRERRERRERRGRRERGGIEYRGNLAVGSLFLRPPHPTPSTPHLPVSRLPSPPTASAPAIGDRMGGRSGGGMR
eukprot:3416091-Rhodomonas_salina.1